MGVESPRPFFFFLQQLEVYVPLEAQGQFPLVLMR